MTTSRTDPIIAVYRRCERRMHPILVLMCRLYSGIFGLGTRPRIARMNAGSSRQVRAMSYRRGITVRGYRVLPDACFLRLATCLRRLTGLRNPSAVEAGHGVLNQSRRRTGVALRTREVVGLASHRLLGGVFERHDFATLYVGFSELGQADRAVCVALLKEPEPFFL